MEPPRHTPPATDTDDLLRRYRETGEPERLGDLFDRTAPELFRIALHLSSDTALAEDAVQETFLTALRSLDRHDPARRVVPWLIGILRNKVRELGRREDRRADPARVAPLRPPLDPAIAAETAEETAEVRRALGDLPEPYREVALLRWRHGLTPAEIAELKSTSPGTVRSLLHRAAGRLRRGLDAFASVLLFSRAPRAPRGLKAVRGEVLRRAPQLGAAAGAAPTVVLLGGMVMKKSLLALAAFTILAGLGVWITNPGGRPAENSAHRNPAPEVRADAVAGARPGNVDTRAVPGPAAKSGAGSITGRVTDTAATPVAAARIVAWPDPVGPGSRPGEPVASATDGRFSVPVPDDAPFFRLLVTAPGFGDALAGPERAGADVAVTLERADAIVGRVLDPEGRPVAGARLRARLELGPVRIERSATSGPDGDYRLEGLPRLAWGHAATVGHLAVAAEGFAPLFLDGVPAPRPEAPAGTEVRQDFVLSRGGVVAGRVLEEGTDRPLAGARVFLWSEEQHPLGGPRGRMPPLAEAVAGADGSFRFEHALTRGGPAAVASIRAPELDLAAFAEGACPRAERLRPPLEGQTVEVVLHLPREAIVTGRVLGPDGAGLEGATVWMERKGPLVPPFVKGAPRPSAKTDERGEYRLRGVPAPGEGTGTAELIVQAGGWRGEPDATVSVRVRAGEETRAADAVVSPPPPKQEAEAILRVVDASGAPVWGAEVTFSQRSHWSDREGRIRIEVPAAWAAPQEVVVRAPGHAPAVVTVTPSRPPPPEVEAVLPDAHRIAGRVVEADGTPARGATVTVADGTTPVDEVFPPDGSPGMMRPKHPMPRLVFLGSTTTAADGTFEIGDLPAGTFHVQAFLYLGPYGGAAFEPMDRLALRDVESGVAADTTDLLLRLSPDESSPHGAISGTVVDGATRAPAFTFRILLSRGEKSFYAHGPDLSVGRFDLRRVPAGTWTVRVMADGYAPVERDVVVRAGATAEVRVELTRGATLTGRLRIDGGGSLAGATIRLSPEAGATATAATTIPVSPDGTFHAAGFLPGSWSLSVVGKGPSEFGGPMYVPADGAPVVVPAGREEVRADLLVTRAGILTVTAPPARATGADDGAQAFVRVFAAGGRVAAEGAVLPSGSVLRLGWAPLAPGDYEVRLERPNHPPEVRTVRIVAGGRVTVDFPRE